MGKEQISIRLEPEILSKIDELATKETRTRNNMIEVLIQEAINARDDNARIAELSRLPAPPLLAGK